MQCVVDDYLLLQILTVLLSIPTDDSVVSAASLLRITHRFLSRTSPRTFQPLMERCRSVLNEGILGSRAQSILNDMFTFIQQQNHDKTKDILDECLDLVEEKHQKPHDLRLEDDFSGVDKKDFFKVDPKYAESMSRHTQRLLLMGLTPTEDENDKAGPAEDDDLPPPEDDAEEMKKSYQSQSGRVVPPHSSRNDVSAPTVISNAVLTGDDLLAFRKRIALIMQGSMQPEEAAHKILRACVPGQEPVAASLVVEACCQNPTYSKFYGNLAAKLVGANSKFLDAYETLFQASYEGAEDMTSKQTRHTANIFAHLLFTDSISYGVFTCIRLTAETTTTDGRVFLKYLFEELTTLLSPETLAVRLHDPSARATTSGLFPNDSLDNARYAIAFFAQMGLSALTEDLQKQYAGMKRRALENAK